MSNPDDYTIGWICALHEELVAATAFLDEEHDPPDRVSRHDANDYTLGKMGRHNVVIAVLPSSEYGTASAASVARDMVHSFPNIRLGLMVGIGGGAPSKKHDIRLGDVVVSNPDSGIGGVFQYDFGKMLQGQGFQATGVLDQPPRVLRTAVNGLRARYARSGHNFQTAINEAFETSPKLRSKYSQPKICTDRLYQSGVIHPYNKDGSCAEVCGDDPVVLVSRSQRIEGDDNPAIHYGVIASANQVMKDALVRDSIATANHVLCFEMEAAGLMNTFPCLVIRGICDYADSHKNKEWQGYAAMTAAAYAKDVLLRIVPDSVQAERKLSEMLSDNVANIRKATDEIHRISKQQLEIHQEAVKRSLSDKERNCLHMFRRTSSGNDDTYEWSKDRVADRVEGTCNWLTEHDNFKEWLKQEYGPLLVSADPGCGKSVLAKYLVDCYLPSQVPTGSVTICYFFFRDPDQSTVHQALCALLHQLFCQKSHLVHHAMKEYEHNGEHLIESSRSLWNILRRAVEDPETGPVIILLDALDECADFDDLMRNLQAHVRSQQFKRGRLRYLLTSRPYESIVSRFRGLWDAFPQIHIPGEESSEIISQEINRVIEYKINQLAEQQELSEQVKDHLASCFLKIPHRTYLWLYLVFDNLHSEGFKQTLKGVESAISILPRSIHEAYARVLSKSKEDKIVRKALSIILAAERPLTLGEMNVALSIERTSQSILDIDLETESHFQSRLRSLCGLFVSVHHGRVYFLHQTAREFLLADAASISGISPELRWRQCMTMQGAHRVLAPLCVRYLSFFSSDKASLGDATSEGRGSHMDRTFLNYSAEFWGLHFRQAHISVADDDAIVRLVLEISNPTGKAYSAWFEIFRRADLYSSEGDLASRLTVASYMGHITIVPLLLELGEDVNANVGDGSALHMAAINGHEDVVKVLLDHGANVNVQPRWTNTIIHASELGHNAVIKLLLEKGANVNARDMYDGTTALILASTEGHEAVVKLLLEKGANVNASDQSQRTPLIGASTEGHEATVKLLLDKGANVNAQDKESCTALLLASFHGYEATVKLLLDKGSDVNARKLRYDTTLIGASARGHGTVVKLLLDNGGDVNAQGRHDRTALMVASSRGHETVVKLLLDNGADINAQGRCNSTALREASFKGHETVVKLLLDKRAKVNAQEKFSRTALMAASLGGHEAVVKLLLEKGADVNARERNHRTALIEASEKNHKAVVKLLLGKGADVNARQKYHRTALIEASTRGYEAVVKLLLDNGAEVNMQDRNCDTALLSALCQDNEAVVKLLLHKGADVVVHNGIGGNAIYVAAYRGHARTLELLLSKVTAPLHDTYGRTLLWWAAAGGQIDTVKSLIMQHNFDPRTPNNFDQTPWWIAAKKGHTATANYLASQSGETSIQLQGVSDHYRRGSRLCDVCTCAILEDEYSFGCKLCVNGSWHMCTDCSQRGALCGEPEHDLVVRINLSRNVSRQEQRAPGPGGILEGIIRGLRQLLG